MEFTLYVLILAAIALPAAAILERGKQRPPERIPVPIERLERRG